MNTNPQGFYFTDHPILAVGTETRTFNMGKIVAIKVLEGTPSKWASIYGPLYRVIYTGMERICLDLGQNWWLRPGDVFTCHQNNIDAALRHRKNDLAIG